MYTQLIWCLQTSARSNGFDIDQAIVIDFDTAINIDIETNIARF